MKQTGTVNKKNEEKLKAFLVKQSKNANTKPNSTKAQRPCAKP